MHKPKEKKMTYEQYRKHFLVQPKEQPEDDGEMAARKAIDKFCRKLKQILKKAGRR